MAAESAVGFLLDNVEKLVLYYADLLSKAKDDLDQLVYELRLLKGILKDSADNPNKSETFREMERRIRTVVYEVEDIVDSCICQAIEDKAKSAIRRKLSTKKVDQAEQVKKARQKVKHLFDQAQSEIAKMPPSPQPLLSPRPRSAPSLRQENVVVLKDQEDKVYAFLEDTKHEKMGVYSIVGMPGLGKSTLAWKIFHSEKVKFEFPIRMWVYVSQEFSSRDVLLKILKAISPESHYGSNVTDDELRVAVQEYLSNRMFLLVLDDVWTPNAWRQIENVLPKSNPRGKVVITTRDNVVGSAACAPRPHHELRFLKRSESWELLQYEVFGELNAYPTQLQDIGRKIAIECDGLPLAIVVTGGILKEHYNTKPIPQTIKEWENVSHNVHTYLKINDKIKLVPQMVDLSYSTLSDELRHCLLYLGVFPKGFEIPSSTLTRLWMAEGFVQQKEGQSLEKSAQENLNDLINRNLVMVAGRNIFGEIKKCRVHDVIREFCNSKAAIEEQNLFQEIKMVDGVFSPPVEQIHKHRRLCIHSHLHDLLSKKLQGTSVARSFLCFNKETFVLDTKYNSSIPNNFKLLRVIDSNSFRFPIFPLKVTELIYLRYLTLSCDDLDVLPEAVGSKLWNLQSLILNTNKREIAVKANIWKMTQLRHLKTKAAVSLLNMEPRGEAHENLQMLSRLSPKHCKQDVFDKVPNLKRLGIRGPIETLLDVELSAGTLSHLENMKLQNDLVNEAACDKPLPALPKIFPANLRRLTLSKTYLQWMNMSALAGIHTLEVLKLKDYAFNGDSWKLAYTFPSLQFLLIADTDLRVWEASTGQFPRLWHLSLKNCRKLYQIPECLAQSTLQNLDIERVHIDAVEHARKIKEVKEAMPGTSGTFQLTIAPVRD